MIENIPLWPPAVLAVAIIALVLVLALIGGALLVAIEGSSQQPNQAATTRRPAIAVGRPWHQDPSLTLGQALERHNLLYRTQDGSLDYAFCFVRFGGGLWRNYITWQPSYGCRPTGPTQIHRLNDPEHNRFVCWSVPITSYEDAKTIAARWAEATEQYRKHGKEF